MKFALIGAPGSGKTHIAKVLARHLMLNHIEADVIFWAGKDLRSEVERLVKSDDWILDGHISKLSDIVLPVADKIIVVEGLNLLSLFRSLKRDWKNVSKAWFNVQNYEKLGNKRQEIIEGLLSTRPQDVYILNNFPDLSEGDLAALCKRLKSSAVKAKKPAVKSQRTRDVEENKSHGNRAE